MKNMTRIAGITVVCSLAVGFAIRQNTKNNVAEIPAVVSQQIPGPVTTVADTLTPEDYRAESRRLDALMKAGLVPPAKMPWCCDPTHTIDPTLDQTPAEPDTPDTSASETIPSVRRAGYIVGQGCTRGADGVLVCPPDRVPPIVSAIADRGSNGADWYNGPVTVSFISRDPLPTSGRALPEFPTSVVVASEGQNQLVTSAPSCDPAGNCATGTLKVSIDSVNPSLQVSVPASSASYIQGSVVSAAYGCNDQGSGLNPVDGCVALTAVGAPIDTAAIGRHTFKITATDVAGNTAERTVDYLVVPVPTTTTSTTTSTTTTVEQTTTTTVFVDSVAPVVSVLGVTNGGAYSLGGVPAASCSSSDLGSGVAVQATLARTGGNVDGTGTFVVTCSGAVDRAGNISTPISISYRVRYVVVGGGIGGGSSGGPVNPPPFINTGKAGRAYSAQWQLSDLGGVPVTALSSIQSVTYKSTSCVAFTGDPADALEAVATGNSGLSISGITFRYNWKTPTTLGCYTLFVNTADGTSLTANFKLT